MFSPGATQRATRDGGAGPSASATASHARSSDRLSGARLTSLRRKRRWPKRSSRWPPRVVHEQADDPDLRARANNGAPDVLTVSGQLGSEHPELVARVVGELLEAADWARGNRDKAFELLSQRLATPRPLLELAFGDDLPARLDVDLRNSQRMCSRSTMTRCSVAGSSMSRSTSPPGSIRVRPSWPARPATRARCSHPNDSSLPQS
jgi:hypothetical protein